MRRSLIALVLLGSSLAAGPARADQVTQNIRFTASDGVELQTHVGGEGSLIPRPVIVEFSPYRPGCCATYGGPAYNYLQVHIRGTGDSDGRFDSLGPRTQADVVEVLAWACTQPWSDGRLGLFGFSASAITAYNSLHTALPCVRTAVLGSGTHELYRDLLSPGGVPNTGVGLGVLGLIGAPAAAAMPARLQRNPGTTPEYAAGLTDAARNRQSHPNIDDYWRERHMRGDVNDLPILMVDGFFDVESRGAFQAFRELRDDGAHLMVVGAHDGSPVGSGGYGAEMRAWYDRYLRGIANGIDAQPKVKLWLADGDREDYLAGGFHRVDGADWPIPGTSWASLALDPARSGTARSVNDGTLGLTAPDATTTQPFISTASLPTATDPYTTSILTPIGVGGVNGNALARVVPPLTDMTLAEPVGLSYTTAPLATDVASAGPASLELTLATTLPDTDVFAVISDVSPDGTPHPMSMGRLRTSYPDVDLARSLIVDGDIVQPYGRFDARDPAQPGEERLYRIEFWPIGNRFKAGHRLRLHIVGVSAYHLQHGLGVNRVTEGGAQASRLLFPVLPGSDIASALP